MASEKNNFKSKIAVSLRIVEASNYKEKRDALSHDWVEFFEKIGVFPLFVPNNIRDVEGFLTEMKVDGIILSGGDNVGDDLDRDRTERELIQFSINSKTPLFGVCRGMQAINKFFNGEVIVSKDRNHVSKTHSVKINNMNSKIMNNSNLSVNSFHNNLIFKEGIGKGLTTFAISKDDETVEGFFHKEYPISGVMWHPEREQNKENILIVKEFLKINDP